MALLLGVAMLPAGAIAMQVGVNAVSVRQAAFEESLARRALQSIEGERRLVDEVRELIRVLATSPALQQARTLDCRRWLGEVQAEYSYLDAIALSASDGRVICSIPEAPPGMRPQPSRLREAALARDGFAVGYVEYGRLARKPVLAALEPVHGPDGRQIGLVGASIGVDRLNRLLDRARGLDGARTAIVDSSGRVIAESPGGGDNPPGLPTPRQIRNHLGPQPAFVKVENGDAVVTPLHAPDLYAVVAWAPQRDGFQMWAGYGLSVAAPLLIWLLAVAAGWFAIEIFVARPLSTLETMARSFARGEDVHETPDLLNAPTEIRSLRRTLAAMAKTLRGREARLVEALGEERALLREVHHRVKNNLQMVASLLSIQARGARDDSEAWGLARAHDRVQLLSLVHQRIYASGGLRELRLDDLVAEIARQLISARGATAQNITIDSNLAEARVTVDRAVPLAFLVGESLSTALDALASSGRVTLRIELAQDQDGTVRFVMDADAEAVATEAPATAGRLVDAFARQLGAQVGRHPDRPFTIWLVIPAAPED